MLNPFPQFRKYFDIIATSPIIKPILSRQDRFKISNIWEGIVDRGFLSADDNLVEQKNLNYESVCKGEGILVELWTEYPGQPVEISGYNLTIAKNQVYVLNDGDFQMTNAPILMVWNEYLDKLKKENTYMMTQYDSPYGEEVGYIIVPTFDILRPWLDTMNLDKLDEYVKYRRNIIAEETRNKRLKQLRKKK